MYATVFSPNFSSLHNVFVLGEGNLCSRMSSTAPARSLCQQALLTLHQVLAGRNVPQSKDKVGFPKPHT